MNANYTPKDEIIYLTGLSIDKKRLHKLFKLASTDQDFESVFKSTNTYLNDLEVNKSGKYYLSISEKIQHPVEALNDFFYKFGFSSLGNELLDATILDEVIGFLGLKSLSIIDQLITYKAESVARKIKENAVGGHDFIEHFSKNKDVLEKVKAYNWSDFFSIYLSSQGDSRGVNALASGSDAVDKCYALNYGFADNPFYENTYINAVKIKCCASFYEKINSFFERKKADCLRLQSVSLIHANYNQILSEKICQEFLYHSLDLLLTRAVADLMGDQHEFSCDELDSSITCEILTGLSVGDKEEFKKTMQNRSLFGLDLLSRVLYMASKFLDGNEVLSIRVVDNNTTDIIQFLEELIECAGCPVKVRLVSDGEQADFDVKCEYQNNKGNIINDFSYLFFKNKEPSFSDFICEESNNISIRVPIKTIISLPIVERESIDGKMEFKHNRRALVPSRLIDDLQDGGEVSVFTVGGVEHNKPLMHLINAHRQQYKNERLFGFLDNVFDLEHMSNKIMQEEDHQGFIMGVNQPVSGFGFNKKLKERLDSHEGHSISNSAKQIYFELFDDFFCTKINVLSIYGFSARASAYATLYSLVKIKSKCKEGITNTPLAAAALHLPYNTIEPRGCSTFLEFSQNIEEELHNITEGLEYFSFIRLDSKSCLANFIQSRTSRGGALKIVS